MRHLWIVGVLSTFLIIGCDGNEAIKALPQEPPTQPPEQPPLPPEPQVVEKVITLNYVAKPNTVIDAVVVFDTSSDILKFDNPIIINDFLILQDGILRAIEDKPFPIGYHSYTVLSDDALLELTIQFDIQLTLNELRIFDYLRIINDQSLIIEGEIIDSTPKTILYDSQYSGPDFERRFFLRVGDEVRGIFVTFGTTDLAFRVCYVGADGIIPTSFSLFDCDGTALYELFSSTLMSQQSIDLNYVASPNLVIAEQVVFDNSDDSQKFNDPAIITDFLIFKNGMITTIDGAPLRIGSNTYYLYANDLSVALEINITVAFSSQTQDIIDLLKMSSDSSIALADPTTDSIYQTIRYDSAFVGEQFESRFLLQVGNQIRGIEITDGSAFSAVFSVCYVSEDGIAPASFSVFNCSGATAYEFGSLCTTESGIISTIYTGSGIAVNGSDLFRNASDTDKLACFRKAYLSDILPYPPPDTSDDSTFLNTLPDDLSYSKSQYRLVYHDEFNRPDTAAPYNLNTVLGEDWDVHYGYYWPSDPSEYQHESWRWPIVIKDNKLQVGAVRYPRLDMFDSIGITCTDNSSDGLSTFHIPDGNIRWQAPHCKGKGQNPTCTWTAPTCQCSEHNWSQESCMTGAIGKLFTKYQFKYGYLEVSIESNINGLLHPHAYIDAIIGIPQLFSLSTTNLAGEMHNISGIPSFLARDTLKEELVNFGAEMQIFENRVIETSGIGIDSDDLPVYSTDPLTLYPANVVSWLVLHFGATPDLESRFFNAWVTTRPLSRTYGFEWTPRGYRIWFDGNRVNPQAGDPNPYEQFSYFGSCNLTTLGGAGPDDYIKCGISHVAQAILGISGGYLYSLSAQNPDYNKIDYVRLYKPVNNYSDMDPLYQ